MKLLPYKSAAHCAQNKNDELPRSPRDVLVLIGSYDISNPYHPGTLIVSPSQIIVHPQWNPFVLRFEMTSNDNVCLIFLCRFDADLTLIVLENEISLSSFIMPVCLGPVIEAKEGIIIGYGQSEDKSKNFETTPRMLKVPIKENEECFLENFEFAKISSKRTFCAGSKNGTGACRGDSGSGLFVRVGSRYFLKGIVSSSLFDEHGNCDVNNFSVYTNVGLYLRWIENPNDPESLREENTSVTESPSLNRNESCGVMSESSGLIQGGQQSSSGNFPWTVAIFLREGIDLYEHKAVGTLISNKHVVSLANPLSYLNEANVLVSVLVERLKMYFGIDNLSETSVPGGLIIDGALRITFHPNFISQVPRSADVAIIFLQSPIFLTSRISPACLWTSRNNLNDQQGFAVGWGINELGTYSTYKKFAALKIQGQNICRKFYPDFFDSSKYFCAASTEATPCEYDDPFYVKFDGRWFLSGLINVYFFLSDVNKCSNAPVLYEDVAKYSNWINQAINS